MKIEEYDLDDLLDNLHDGLYFVDINRAITFWNKAAEHITGFSASDVKGCRCADNILTHVDKEGNGLCHGPCPLAATIADGISREAAIFLHHKNGHRIPVSVRTIPLRDKNGTIIGGAEMFTDISDEAAIHQRLEELEKLSLVDDLTQLSNRNHTTSMLEATLQEKKRYDLPFGLLLIDIDNFKQINDTYGRATGDAVLKMVASTLRNSTRPFDHFGRWEDEQFIGIVRNVDTSALKTVGNKCRVLVEKSYLKFENRLLHVTISLGVTLARIDDTAEMLLKRVSTLLSDSKKAGKNRLSAD
jgi:diguanylate cyclase (GGDEF)-like protein/PAS domain S-box-containing protein